MKVVDTTSNFDFNDKSFSGVFIDGGIKICQIDRRFRSEHFLCYIHPPRSLELSSFISKDKLEYKHSCVTEDFVCLDATDGYIVCGCTGGRIVTIGCPDMKEKKISRIIEGGDIVQTKVLSSSVIISLYKKAKKCGFIVSNFLSETPEPKVLYESDKKRRGIEKGFIVLKSKPNHIAFIDENVLKVLDTESKSIVCKFEGINSYYKTKTLIPYRKICSFLTYKNEELFLIGSDSFFNNYNTGVRVGIVDPFSGEVVKEFGTNLGSIQSPNIKSLSYHDGFVYIGSSYNDTIYDIYLDKTHTIRKPEYDSKTYTYKNYNHFQYSVFFQTLGNIGLLEGIRYPNSKETSMTIKCSSLKTDAEYYKKGGYGLSQSYPRYQFAHWKEERNRKRLTSTSPESSEKDKIITTLKAENEKLREDLSKSQLREQRNETKIRTLQEEVEEMKKEKKSSSRDEKLDKILESVTHLRRDYDLHVDNFHTLKYGIDVFDTMPSSSSKDGTFKVFSNTSVEFECRFKVLGQMGRKSQSVGSINFKDLKIFVDDKEYKGYEIIGPKIEFVCVFPKVGVSKIRVVLGVLSEAYVVHVFDSMVSDKKSFVQMDRTEYKSGENLEVAIGFRNSGGMVLPFGSIEKLGFSAYIKKKNGGKVKMYGIDVEEELFTDGNLDVEGINLIKKRFAESGEYEVVVEGIGFKFEIKHVFSVV